MALCSLPVETHHNCYPMYLCEKLDRWRNGCVYPWRFFSNRMMAKGNFGNNHWAEWDSLCVCVQQFLRSCAWRSVRYWTVQCIIFMIFLAGCIYGLSNLHQIFVMCALVATCGIHGSLTIVAKATNMIRFFGGLEWFIFLLSFVHSVSWQLSRWEAGNTYVPKLLERRIRETKTGEHDQSKEEWCVHLVSSRGQVEEHLYVCV